MPIESNDLFLATWSFADVLSKSRGIPLTFLDLWEIGMGNDENGLVYAWVRKKNSMSKIRTSTSKLWYNNHLLEDIDDLLQNVYDNSVIVSLLSYFVRAEGTSRVDEFLEVNDQLIQKGNKGISATQSVSGARLHVFISRRRSE